MSENIASKERDSSIDLLRGSVVLWMVITHTNALFYNFDGHGWLGFFTWLGATVCFTTFLFCSGSVYGMKFKDKNHVITFRKLWQRLTYIITGYYVTAFAVVILGNQAIPSFDEIIKVLFFIEVPIFTEFILAFALADILIFILQRILHRSLVKPYLLLIITILISLFAWVLYNIDFKIEILNAYKSLLVGHEGLHRFGILTYFPVLAVGLLWGYWNSKLRERSIVLVAVLAALAAFIIFSEQYLGFRQDRWPPSVLFLSYGMAYIALFLLLVPYILKLKPLSNALKFLSNYTFEYYQLHVIVMYTLSIVVNGAKYDQLTAALMAVLVVLMVTLLIKLIIAKRERFST